MKVTYWEGEQLNRGDFMNFSFIDLTHLLGTGNHSQVVDIAKVQNADYSLDRMISVLSVHRV